jgi:energy-coupling factor transport system permease protein
LNRAFFLPRSSGLHRLHPLTKLVGVFALLLIGFLAQALLIPYALFLFVVLPLAAWGRVLPALLRVTFAVVLPFAVSVVLIQGLFFPGASSVAFALGPLAFKQEGLIFALSTAGRILLLAGAALLLLFSTHPADLMLALEQKGLPNALTYIVVTAIQLFPQMQVQAAEIQAAQRARGLETEGALLNRLRAVLPLLSPLVTRALVQVDERAMALEARAFTAPRAKTSFRQLIDTQGQRIARWVMFAAALIVGVAERLYG